MGVLGPCPGLLVFDGRKSLPSFCFFIFIFINIHFCLFLLKKNKKIKLHSLFEVNLEVADSI